MSDGRKTAILICLACALALALSDAALAQSSLGIGAAEPAIKTDGLFGSVMSWINTQQQTFYRSLSTALKAMRDDPTKLWVLIGLSFSYGIFHAAGPGHGKAVISSYLIANEQALRRGVAISFLAAIMQGLVAIGVVGVTYFALRGSGISMTVATWWLEIASYALIAGFGGWLLFRKLRPSPAHDDHHHHVVGPDGACATCGHSHAPDPVKLQSADFDLRGAWSAIVAIGLRPCSGALIVLTFALLNGLYLGGLLSVASMSIGTAITVSILATLAVTAKGVAVRFASTESAAMRVTHVIEIAGAALVLILGLTLLTAALQA
ncbi:nickel/cobalt transporter [Hoeflea sp. WL0058]|uniref:Nickel/cobalt efflux system n=1 Tax=Flavimaribacter sediminis TaxID=2865987 RepID=A0AAE3D2L5_9HYPH|nr:nickel/cobalt transporter [Flavimaribacter sediminis]MBW8639247.1 nickel/cobalt transporter [Flavimaribacter sediminis]